LIALPSQSYPVEAEPHLPRLAITRNASPCKHGPCPPRLTHRCLSRPRLPSRSQPASPKPDVPCNGIPKRACHSKLRPDITHLAHLSNASPAVSRVVATGTNLSRPYLACPANPYLSPTDSAEPHPCLPHRTVPSLIHDHPFRDKGRLDCLALPVLAVPLSAGTCYP